MRYFLFSFLLSALFMGCNAPMHTPTTNEACPSGLTGEWAQMDDTKCPNGMNVHQ